jgi:hypothetical protein
LCKFGVDGGAIGFRGLGEEGRADNGDQDYEEGLRQAR